MKSLNENELMIKSKQALKECLSLIPDLEIKWLEETDRLSVPGFCFVVQGNSLEQKICIEVRKLGTPKSVREAVNKLIVHQQREIFYGVMVAPYISPASALICQQAGMGFVDLSGNCHIAFGQIYIHRENMPNRYPLKTGLSSLYSPKSERILRVLLSQPYRAWKTMELAEEARVSPGMITHVRRKLEEEEWGKSVPEGLCLVQPEKLLADWSANYSLERNQVFEYYSMKSLTDIEELIAGKCHEMGIRYALTGFSAASRIAPMVRGQRAMIYIDGDTHQLANQSGLKSVDSGANILLILPYDSGVFWNLQTVNTQKLVCDIQLFLDLKRTHGRGEEAADTVFKGVVEPAWQQQAMIMKNR